MLHTRLAGPARLLTSYYHTAQILIATRKIHPGFFLLCFLVPAVLLSLLAPSARLIDVKLLPMKDLERDK